MPFTPACPCTLTPHEWTAVQGQLDGPLFVGEPNDFTRLCIDSPQAVVAQELKPSIVDVAWLRGGLCSHRNLRLCRHPVVLLQQGDSRTGFYGEGDRGGLKVYGLEH